MPRSLGRSLFFFSMCGVPGILGYRVAPVLLCGVAVPLCVRSVSASSLGACRWGVSPADGAIVAWGVSLCTPGFRRFSAIFAGFSGVFCDYLTQSHYFAIFQVSFSGVIWALSRAWERGRVSACPAWVLCALGPLCASLLRFWGRGAIPTFPRLSPRLGLPAASCVICPSFTPSPSAGDGVRCCDT